MLINNDTIIKDSDPAIRLKSEKVPVPLSKEDNDILMSMLQYVRDSIDPEKAQAQNLRPAVGISAVQIGILKQLVAISIDYGEDGKTEFALANPRIISHSVQNSYLKNGEGCLSVEEEHEGHVFRHARIKVKAYDALSKQEVIISARDYEAIVLQHEIDHLSGTLFYDTIDPNDPWKEDPEAVVIE